MSSEIVLTYSNQPNNVGAWSIGEACSKAKPGGDYIDHGLSLLQELQDRGYGIVPITDERRRALDPFAPPSSATPGDGMRAWVGDMKTSAGMDYYVCVGWPDRYMTPQLYQIRGRAEYDVAEWNHLLGHCEEPDILAFDTEPPPQERAGSDAGARFDATPAAHVARLATRPQPASDASGGDDLGKLLRDLMDNASSDGVAGLQVPSDATQACHDKLAAELATLSRALAESREQSDRFCDKYLAALSRAEAAERDAERYRWCINQASWIRYEERTYMAVPVKHGADLSCIAFRYAAIEAAMAPFVAAQQQEGQDNG